MTVRCVYLSLCHLTLGTVASHSWKSYFAEVEFLLNGCTVFSYKAMLSNSIYKHSAVYLSGQRQMNFRKIRHFWSLNICGQVHDGSTGSFLLLRLPLPSEPSTYFSILSVIMRCLLGYVIDAPLWTVTNMYPSVGEVCMYPSVGKGCSLWLWHSLDFSLTFFQILKPSHSPRPSASPSIPPPPPHTHTHTHTAQRYSVILLLQFFSLYLWLLLQLRYFALLGFVQIYIFIL